MLAATQALASLAVLSVGVIYGTDIFSAVVLRPAMAALADRELTQAAGRIHQYGDQRLPFPGIAGIAAAAAAAICAGLAGHAAAAALAGATAQWHCSSRLSLAHEAAPRYRRARPCP